MIDQEADLSLRENDENVGLWATLAATWECRDSQQTAVFHFLHPVHRACENSMQARTYSQTPREHLLYFYWAAKNTPRCLDRFSARRVACSMRS